MSLHRCAHANSLVYNSAAAEPHIRLPFAGIGGGLVWKLWDTFQRKLFSRAWFRSTDLWVMGPARFHCATLLGEVREVMQAAYMPWRGLYRWRCNSSRVQGSLLGACGAMDNASDYGSEDSRFESWQARKVFLI